MAMRKGLGYIRVSTAEQVDGFGLEVQRRSIRDYCKANGLRLVDILADEGQSGSNGLDSRVGLAGELAIAERGGVAAIVVYRLDRLARDLLLQETVMARMRAAGVEVVSVSEPDIDSDDPTRVLVRQVLGAIGQYEKALIRGRMMSGKAVKVAGGGYGGGRPRFGYRAQGGDLIADKEEQRIVARIHQLADEGASTRDIARKLNDDGNTTKAGGTWSSVQVWRVLQRR
ncbi:MAG: recombinase family protein [Acidimicrobiales bacterium]